MKLLNTFLNKVSKKDFKNMIKSVAALKLFASSMQDEDILRSLYVLSFNDIPNKDFSIKEAITRRADAKEKLNLVERQLIAKEVCTVLKNASALFDSELANITNNDNNFIQPKNTEFIKSAKFGLLANVNGKYHLVNPLTNRVASEFIIEAADERYAKLHELVGQYRKENKISYFDESDGMMVLTGSPEVINDLEHKVKDIGYYCEAVNEETGAEGERPEYSLKVFIDKVASSASKVSKISSFSKISELRDSKVDFPNPIEDKLYETKDVLVEFGAHSFDTPDTPLVKNEIGGFSDLVYVIEKKIDNSIVPVASQYVVYNDGGYGLSAIKYHTSGESISEDDMSRAISAINQDFGKRFSKFESDSNSHDLQIKDIDTTNTNLEKDNPMLKHEGVTDEVVEKTSAEKPVEKKADIDFDAIKTAIQPYGWSIDEEGFLHNRKGNNTGAQVTFKKGRYQLRFSNSGRLIFSTGNPSDFAEAIEKLWYAQKIDTPSADNTEDNVESAKKEEGVEKKAEEKIDFEKELMEAGESKGKKDKVNKEQLEMGKEVEKEHTTNPEIAEKITRDHLAEIPDYYTHLKEMEDNAKKNDTVKSSYAPFITIDATTTDEVKVVAGEKVVCTCKTIQAAFEKSANEFAYDGNEGARTTHKIYEDEKIIITAEDQADEYFVTLYVGGLDQYPVHGKSINKERLMADADKVNFSETESEENPRLKEFGVTLEMLAKADEEATKVLKGGTDPEGKAEAPVEAATKTEVKKEAEDVEDNVWVVEKTSAPTIDDQLTLDIFYVVNKNTHVVAHDSGFEPFLFPTQKDAQEYADKLNSQKEASAKPEVKKEVDNKNQEFVDPEGNTHTFIISVDEKSEHPYKLQHLINNKEVGFESVDFEADIKQSIQHIKDAYSSLNKGLSKKADEELKQFDMKQEKDGQKEFEKQDDSLKDVSIPEEKEDTSEVNEAMSAKPTQNKGESFSASEFGNNLAYIKQNNPEDFESIMANLKQLMVGDQKPMYDFLELWSQNNFQNFTETTRVDPTYERHSQYQEQLKNNVLPKVMEMSEYKKAMEEKVSAEKGA